MKENEELVANLYGMLLTVRIFSRAVRIGSTNTLTPGISFLKRLLDVRMMRVSTCPEQVLRGERN